MDDLLLLHPDPAYLRLATLQIAVYLQSLGWTLSLAKCEFTPKQEITFLGWRWDFMSLSLRMTQDMRKTLLFMIKQWLRRAVAGAKVSCKKLGRLIGCLNFLRAQIPRASLYLRTLHTALAEMVRLKGWNGWGSVTRRIISKLLFWWRSVWYNAPYGFRPRPVQALLTTDAAERGWGAVLTFGSVYATTHGFFSIAYSSASSKLRETTAVLRAPLYFRSALAERGIHQLAIRSDNMVTVFNLQRQGASESLLHETRRIFSILQKLDIRISVTYLPGKENVTADSLSRMDLVGDYELGKEVFEEALGLLGVRPTVDAFANRNNHKCDRFWSLPGPLSNGPLPSGPNGPQGVTEVSVGRRVRRDGSSGLAVQTLWNLMQSHLVA
jgi:hypothetical protein